MELNYTLEGTKAIITVGGKLLVSNASELEEVVEKLSRDAVDYVLDISDLKYITSAGLRVIVGTQKVAESRGGTLRLLHPTDEVMEIFELTGLADILFIER